MMERRKNLNDKFGFVDSMKIKDFIDYEQPNEYIVESDRYNSKYSTPVLTAGQSFILGYTNESKGIYKKGPCIIFDDFTTSVHYVDFPFKVKSSAMKILTTKSNTDLKYCYYLLLSLSKMPPNHKRQWISTTSEKNHVLPSMDRQISIVKQLDLISDTIVNYTNQIENLDNLVKARFIEMFGDININNKNWHTEHLGKLCNIVRGSSPRPIEKYLGGDIPWIKIGDATDEDNIYLNSTKEHIIREGVNKSRFVKKGSLIFANCGVSLGFARIISFDGCIHDGWLALENIDYRLNKEFLLLSLNQLTDHFRIIAPSGTQPNLNIAIMQNFMQVIPPMELQETFVSFRRHVDKSREAVKKSLEKTQQLYDSLMQEYFG